MKRSVTPTSAAPTSVARSAKRKLAQRPLVKRSVTQINLYLCIKKTPSAMSRPLLLLTMATLLCAGSLNAQTSHVGLPVLDDYMRRQQLLGDSTQPASLMIRPAYLPTEAGERAVFRLMPLVWKQQYTTTRPWGSTTAP